MDAYIMLITNCHKVGELSSSNSNDKSSRHEVFRVTGVDALSLTGNHLDREELPYMPGSLDEDYYEDAMQYGSQNPCRPLISFFQRGTFYFSPSMDLTRNIQAQKLRLGVDEDLRMPDLKFTWNHYFMDVLYEFRNTLSSESRQVFDSLGFVIPLISGSIEIAPLSSVVPEAATPSAREGKVAIVSRASALRAGMRFLTRGIDDFGGVANEVETELLFITPEYTLSFVQLRGSVPVFWEQTGFQIGTHRIHLTRVPQAAYPAAKLHFEDILERYKSVHILNLLKAVPDAPGGGGGGGGGPSTPQTPGGERELSKAFETQIKMLGLPQQLLAYTAFDYHAAVRNNQHHRIKELILSIEGSIRRYQYFLMSNTDGTVFKLQRGAMRTNCMDCLDRTNIVQSVVARTVLTTYLNGCFYEEGNTAALDATLDSVSRLWSKNGNQLAIAYTGTGALKSEVTATGKSTFSGILSDFSKSVNRLLQNNIYDERKQSVIDTVMGRDPITSPPLI
ncbi:Inositol-1,4,5-trisphosphate 5-phosphatase 1, partial [Spiromyces aspiralis]